MNAMMRVTEPLKVRRVRVKALRPKFCVNGRQVAVGEEHVLDWADASFLLARGVAELVAEEPPRMIPAKELADPPGSTSGWMAGT